MGVSTLFREDLKSRSSSALAGVLLLVAGVVYGLLQTFNTAYLNNMALFGQLMTTPLTPIAPLVAVLLGCVPIYRSVHSRHLANIRSRIDVREYVGAKLLACAVVAFAFFFIFSLLQFTVAFVVWPALGNPGLDPALYGMNQTQAEAAAQIDSSYSSLLRNGAFFYGLAYSAWLGLGGALYSLLGAISLFVLPSLSLALLAPFLIYIGETVVVAQLGVPQGALMYSLFPFGLTQIPTLVAAAPQLVLLLGLGVGCVLLLRELPQLERAS